MEELLWARLLETEVLLDRLAHVPEAALRGTQRKELVATLQSVRDSVQLSLRCLICTGSGEFCTDTLKLAEDSLEMARAVVLEGSKVNSVISTTMPGDADALPIHNASNSIGGQRIENNSSTPTYRFINGAWTLDESLEQRNEKLAARRLKRDYDQQVKNIHLLEKERNELQVKMATLEEELQQARKGRRR